MRRHSPQSSASSTLCRFRQNRQCRQQTSSNSAGSVGFMPTVLRFNADAIRTRFDRAAGYLGIDGGFEGFCAFVDSFNASFTIPKTLSDLGVQNPDLDILVRDALNDPSTGGNPVEMTQANTRALFESVM
ncbi:MAG: iron-containing alcohol dehydrogenase [Planctomycetia bacterium]|nr:iron-containing alcohol dehydrogenase [Planctomycetia bacterium]